MGRSIAVVSGKGGVGKTTIACGLALTLAKQDKGVCLIDLDVGLNNIDVLLGVNNKVVYDLGDCLSGKCRIKQALVSDSRLDNLYILPSVRFSKENINLSGIKEIVRKLVGVFDYVIIDAPAGMGENFQTAVNAANDTLVVVTPHITALRDADKVISFLKGLSLSAKVVVNRIRGDMVARKEMINHEQIEKLLKTKVVGVVPESDDINILTSLKFEKIAKTKIIDAFSILAENIKLDQYQIYDYTSKYKGLIGAVRRNLKRAI